VGPWNTVANMNTELSLEFQCDVVTVLLIVTRRSPVSSWCLETVMSCLSCCLVPTNSEPCCRPPASGQLQSSRHWLVFAVAVDFCFG